MKIAKDLNEIIKQLDRAVIESLACGSSLLGYFHRSVEARKALEADRYAEKIGAIETAKCQTCGKYVPTGPARAGRGIFVVLACNKCRGSESKDATVRLTTRTIIQPRNLHHYIADTRGLTDGSN